MAANVDAAAAFGTMVTVSGPSELPVAVFDSGVGGLTVLRKTPGEYPERAIDLLETFASQSALAIENARLYRETLDKAKYEQELRVAAAIQQSLLPVANRLTHSTPAEMNASPSPALMAWAAMRMVCREEEQ